MQHLELEIGILSTLVGCSQLSTSKVKGPASHNKLHSAFDGINFRKYLCENMAPIMHLISISAIYLPLDGFALLFAFPLAFG